MNGTIAMEINDEKNDKINLSGKNICAIIRTCSECRVRTFTLSNLQIVFGDAEERPPHQIAITPENKNNIEEEIYFEAKEEKESSLEDEMDLLRLENPLLFEKLQEGELDNANL